MASPYSDREPTDEFSRLSKSIATDLQRSGQLMRQLQSSVKNSNESATSFMRDYKHVEALVKSIADRMKVLRTTLPAVGKQERAKMEKRRLQDNLLELLTQLKDVDKQLSVELKQRNELEKQRLGALKSRNSGLVQMESPDGHEAAPGSNPFFLAGVQADLSMDPLHQQQREVQQEQQRQLQLQQQQVEYEETLLAIQERDEAMRELEQGVLQVNEIFKDMAHIVHDQGEIIDNIETQIDKAESSARLANQNLDSAVKYQKRGSRTKFIIFAILLGIVCFILFVVWLAIRN